MNQDRGGTQPGNPWRAELHPHRAGDLPWWAEPPSLAILTAVALLASFPPVGAWVLEWVAFGPLVWAFGQTSETGKVWARTRPWVMAGYGFGLAYWAGQLSWLGYALCTQGGIAPGPALAFYSLFVAFLACLPALAFGAVAAARAFGLNPALTLPLAFGTMDAVLGVWPFDGIGWGSLAAPQAHTLAAALLLPLLGAPGLVAALGFVGAAWATLAPRLRTGVSRQHWYIALALGVVTLGLLAPWPGDVAARFGRERAPAISTPQGGSPETFRAVLVPGNLTLQELWQSEGKADSLRYYLARTLRFFAEHPAAFNAPAPSAETPAHLPAGASPEVAPSVSPPPSADLPTLVVWPESAAMRPLTQGRVLVELSGIGAVVDADVLAGSDADDPGRPTNALFLVMGSRFDFSRYDKRRLVPFGEYVPGGFRWLFGRKVTAGDQDYVAGRQPPILEWRGIRLGVAICFESILPEHARQAASGGAQVLIVAANSAWLPGYAQAQHILLTAIRARETGRDALFVSNGGASAYLRAGAPVAWLPAGTGPAEVHPRIARAVTPWTRWGLWGFAGFASLIVGGTLALSRRRRRPAP